MAILTNFSSNVTPSPLWKREGVLAGSYVYGICVRRDNYHDTGVDGIDAHHSSIRVGLGHRIGIFIKIFIFNELLK